MKKYLLLIALLALIPLAFLSGAQGQYLTSYPFDYGGYSSPTYYSTNYPFYHSYVHPSFYPTNLPYRFYGYPYLYPFGDLDDWWGIGGGFFDEGLGGFGEGFGDHEGFGGHGGRR
jgi:hypothetical protein